MLRGSFRFPFMEEESLPFCRREEFGIEGEFLGWGSKMRSEAGWRRSMRFVSLRIKPTYLPIVLELRKRSRRLPLPSDTLFIVRMCPESEHG